MKDCAHWEGLMFKVTRDLNTTGSDILADIPYGILNQIGIQITLHFLKQV